MKAFEILFSITLKPMYKARLCSSQEIPPPRWRFPCSELLCGASEGAPAAPAQVSGRHGACKRIGTLRARNGAGGLRSPALTAAVRSRAALRSGRVAARCPLGWDLATDPITSHHIRADCPCNSFWLKAVAQSYSWTFYSVKKKNRRGQPIDFHVIPTI